MGWLRSVSIKHNTPKFFPVDFLGMTQDPNSSHKGGEVRTVETTTSHIGTEIWLKGISLVFIVWLEHQLPHCALHVSQIHFANSDYPGPNEDKLHKNYTDVKELDKNIYYFKQSQPTTSGAESVVTTDGLVCNDMDTNAYDGDKMYKVLKGDTDMTPRPVGCLHRSQLP